MAGAGGSGAVTAGAGMRLGLVELVGSGSTSISSRGSSCGGSSSSSASKGTRRDEAASAAASAPRSEVMTNGLPCHSAERLRPTSASAPVARARPAVARDTPVATRMATKIDGDEQDGGTGRTECRRAAGGRRPRRGSRRRHSSAPGVRERRRPLGHLGQPADAEQAEHRPDGQAPGIGPFVLLTVVVDVPGPIEQQGEAGAGGDQREKDAGPARQIASPVSTPWPMGPSCLPQRARASRTPSVISPTAHRSRAWRRQNGGASAPAAAWPGLPASWWFGRQGASRRPRGSWSPQWGRD